MSTPKPIVDAEAVDLAVENIGGISEASVEFERGVTVLVGRNATNRTSLLRAIMAGLGSDDVSVKADADRGGVRLTVGETEYRRELTRDGDRVIARGDPMLEDAELADLFAFLLESNAARNAIPDNEELYDLIMRPVDTEEIEAEIDKLQAERDRIEAELEEIDQLKRELPDIAAQREELTEEIEDTRARLQEKEEAIEAADADVEQRRAEKHELEEQLERLRETRADLEETRQRIDIEEESLDTLREERSEVEAELEDLPSAPDDDIGATEEDIKRLRDRKRELESTIDDLQSTVEFNRSVLETDQSLLGHRAATNGGAVTDQLLSDGETVTCWTCGTEVPRSNIEETVDTIRDTLQEKLAESRELEDEIDELQSEREDLRASKRQRRELRSRLEQLENEIETRTERLESLRDRRAELGDRVETLEAEVEERDDDAFDELLELHKEANRLELELERLEDEREELREREAAIEERLEERDDLEARVDAITERIEDLRTRVDRIERDAVEQFNEKMAEVLEVLQYDNIERIWIEQKEQEVRRGRSKEARSTFELHVVRETDSGTSYADTAEHLSESEREVAGLVFALAGYLVHELNEQVPFMLLDSIEAIDADRIAALVDYFSEYAQFLVVALLPEDAQALDDDYTRVRDF